MPTHVFGRAVVVLLFAIVFCYGLASLRSGQTRSRGHLFTRDDNPLGYWISVIVSLVGPIVIIYLVLTR
jgi:hypothetical protein